MQIAEEKERKAATAPPPLRDPMADAAFELLRNKYEQAKRHATAYLLSC